MRRRRRRGGEDAITLFPFLAVLICTVGSLIVLLVVVVEQAKANAASVSQQRDSARASLEEQRKTLRERKEEFSWRMEVLESSRQQTAEQLEDRRRELSHLENELRILSQELDAAIDESQRIVAEESDQVAQQAASEKQVERLRERLASAKRDLEVAREALSKRKPSYSIVAYDGPHGTERRPVFIECTGESVILQPEGVELYGVDFQPPITDDNPLAAALRAKRQYLASTFRGQDNQPYPLIIVRPDGAQAYAAARTAMKSWDAEFGYELVESDLELKFPKRDPAMVAIVMDAVEEARFQRQRLKSIAPARFGRRKPATLTASRNGGFVSNGGTGGDRGTFSRQGSGQPNAYGSPSGQGNGNSSSTGTPGSLGNRFGRPGPIPSGSTARATGGFGNSPNSPRGNRDISMTSSGAINGGRLANGNPSDSFNTSGQGGFGGNGQGSGNGDGQGSGDGNQERSPYEPDPNDPTLSDFAETDPTTGGSFDGNAATGGDSGQGNSTRGNSASKSQNSQRFTGSQSTASSSSTGSNATSSGGAGGSGGAQAPSFGSPGQPASGVGSMSVGASAMNQPPMQPMANAHGADWGLPSGAQGSVGITRPIPMLLTGRYLEIKPEDRRVKPQRLDLQGPLQDEVDKLITTLWARMDKWGIAGAGMHWKPVLSVRVHPSGEQRFQELSQLLQNSGIVVKRKN